MITRGYGTNTIITRGMADALVNVIMREVLRFASKLVMKIDFKSFIDK